MSEPILGYVKTSDGEWLIQIPDPNSQWGFRLVDEEQTWDGGIGIATEWAIVPPAQVPTDVQARLGWILDQEGGAS